MSTPETPARPATATDQDERQLAELGYKQELNRAWSGFTAFAISFKIISVTRRDVHDVRLRVQNGGPIARTRRGRRRAGGRSRVRASPATAVPAASSTG